MKVLKAGFLQLLGIFLVSGILFQHEAQAAPTPLAVTEAFADFDTDRLTLTGTGFVAPTVVKLVGSGTVLTQVSLTPTVLVVNLPISLIPGDYVVTVTAGNKIVTNLMTLGLIGPTGPQGPTGPIGPQGATGPAGTGWSLVLKDDVGQVVGIVPDATGNGAAGMVIIEDGGYLVLAMFDFTNQTLFASSYGAPMYVTNDCTGPAYEKIQLWTPPGLSVAYGQPVSHRSDGPAEWLRLISASEFGGSECSLVYQPLEVWAQPVVPYTLPDFIPPFHVELE